MTERFPLHSKNIGVKSEFGFDTAAAVRRSVAKRMSELLTPIFFEWRANFMKVENLKNQPRSETNV